MSDNSLKETWFGRCIFLSWYCEIGTCKFCYRSTMKHKIMFAHNAKRSLASILADSILGKELGWKIEFLTGGYGIFEFKKIVEIAKLVSEIFGHKIWINLGVLEKEELEELKPYVEGVCASVETVEPGLHKYVCPDKPIEPYSKMLKLAKRLGFQTSMTIIIGLGEKKQDFDLLKEFIKEHEINQITFYALKPVRGTAYENAESPDVDYYAWWIRQTRNEFPHIKIVAGITPKKIDYVKAVLEAGANVITKFPAVTQFNSEKAKSIEEQARIAGRTFLGTLTKYPNIDMEYWKKRLKEMGLENNEIERVIEKLGISLKNMKKKQINSCLKDKH